MITKRDLLAAALAGFLATRAVTAQTILMGFDAGQRTDTHANGIVNTSYFGSLNMSMVLAGAAGKSAAFLLPISGEMRYSSKEYIDANLFTDVAVRFSDLTLGGGGAFSWDITPEIPDRIAGGSTGRVIVNYPMSFGYSGFAKLNTGPEGRFFIQGRYTQFPSSMSFQYKSAENLQFEADNNLPNTDVPALDNSSIRAAAGVVMPGNTIMRFQYVTETWRYQRIFDNKAGAYDRDSKIYSFGFTWYF